jgi:hypothetical protein
MFGAVKYLADYVRKERQDLQFMSSLEVEDLLKSETVVDVENIRNIRQFYLDLLIDLQCSLTGIEKLIKEKNETQEEFEVPNLPIVPLKRE